MTRAATKVPDAAGGRTGGQLSRRRLIALAGASSVPLGSAVVSPGTAATSLEPIIQPDGRDDPAMIERAFEMRRLAIEKGDQAYGAVVARNGVIVGQSWSRVMLDGDPTGHAEVSAIRDACRRTGSRHLRGAVLYSSSRPCPMCEAAAYWAGIEGMVSGRDAVVLGAPTLCPSRR